jgi:hypothetical protein
LHVFARLLRPVRAYLVPALGETLGAVVPTASTMFWWGLAAACGLNVRRTNGLVDSAVPPGLATSRLLQPLARAPAAAMASQKPTLLNAPCRWASGGRCGVRIGWLRRGRAYFAWEFGRDGRIGQHRSTNQVRRRRVGFYADRHFF